MLVKVDRASMAFALEVRPPLLAHRVVEAAWALPPNLRVDGRTGKQALRLILDRYVPRHLVDRPKTGFDPPLAAWLRGPLRSWAEELLSPERLRAQELIDPGPVSARWQELLSGRGGREYGLWSVLMLQSWLADLEGA
jgi:asparagine synthase (glutamine-hydrolysing)